jgi:hypothetical protein
MTTPTRWAIAATVLIAVAFAGCSHSNAATQPAPNVTTFQRGVFDELPLPPRATPIGSRSDHGSVVTRSYKVPGTTPSDVLEFYRRTLTDWQMIEKPHPVGTSTVRGTWTKGPNRLEIAAYAATTVGTGAPSGGVDSQLSLVLRENGAATGS